MRLSLVAKKMNVATTTIVERLSAKGFNVDSNPNTKLSADQLQVVADAFDFPDLMQASQTVAAAPAAAVAPAEAPPARRADDDLPRYFRPSDAAETPPPAAKPAAPAPVAEPAPEEGRLPGLKVLGKIDLNAPRKPAPQAPPAAEKPAPQPVEPPTVVADVPRAEAPAPLPEPPRAETPAPQPELPQAPRPVEPPKAQPEAPRAQPEPPKAEPSRPPQPPVAPPPVVPPAKPEPAPQPVAETPSEPELIEAKGDKLKGLTVVGKITLPVETPRGRGSSNTDRNADKKKRKRIQTVEPANTARGRQGQPGAASVSAPQPQQPQTGGGGGGGANRGGGNRDKRRDRRDEPSQAEVKGNIRSTMAQMGNTKKDFGAKGRRDRRVERARQREEDALSQQEQDKILRVTEFISAGDLASLMDVSVNEIISTCMQMGMFVSINQRLDAEALTIIADEFGFDIEFISTEEEAEAVLIDETDAPEDLQPRAPIVTIMGHVDHGKTSLLDYIRKTRVASGEAGGITQHIGAYEVTTKDGRRITFLDTPGHEAFTAMRARGAKVTDVAIIVIAADDSVMPQTREAINHAQNAGVPMVFAFSKVDKPGANTEKIREELAQMNILVEEWGGKFQTQEISSKSGMGIPDLLEKVLLESEFLDLKANPDRRATGTVIEASLDKGRGYVTTVLIENGTLNVGDVMLAGPYFGRVKAMFDDAGKKIKAVGPSQPAQVLGLTGAPTAGDRLNVTENERDARDIAVKREQLLREQSLRTRKHITLDEIGRRKAIGTFKELNIIVKGDVDGSVEALSDSLLKLSTEEVEVRIIHKGVGQVTESDVLLASAADAVVVAFQVRPSANARKLAEQEEIEIRPYSVIYNAIEDIKKAMEGMLEPEFQEVITGNVEVREVFRISKIGTVAGSYVTEGTIKRNNKIRVIRDFIVIHEGEIQALKRFKDDVNEVRTGYECGLSVKNFNDIEIGDVIECFEMQEVKRKL